MSSQWWNWLRRLRRLDSVLSKGYDESRVLVVVWFLMIYLKRMQLINPSIEIKMVENTPDDPRQRKPDISKAKEVLGWEPKVKLREGLPLMEEDFRLRLNVPKN